MLGGKAAPLIFTLIPAQTESKAVHTEAYHAMRRALRALTAVKTCDSCECCRCISDLLTDHIVKCALRSPHYITKHELPISHGLSGNSWAFQNIPSNAIAHTFASGLAAIMDLVCKPSLVVPPQYLGLDVHSRGKRGRPLHGDQGEDKGEESGGCSDRVQQTHGLYCAEDYCPAGDSGFRR